MRTVSEYQSDNRDYTAEIVYHEEQKRWQVFCYFENREIDEQIFPTEREAEDCAEDFVLQGNSE